MDWNTYFLNIANEVSKKSNCLSVKRGCIIVRDKQILSMGYNGPPSGFPHCDNLEYRRELFNSFIKAGRSLDPNKEDEAYFSTEICPRKTMGFPSGEGLQYCPASHAEANAISQAARNGIELKGSTLYCNFKEIPCRECSKLIVNTSIVKVVLKGEITDYTQEGILGRKILGMCGIEVDWR